MSREDIERLRRSLAAFNRGDWDDAVDWMDPDVVWSPPQAMPDSETYRGREGVKEFWRMLREVFGEFRLDPKEVIDAGDRLVARLEIRGTGKASGVETEVVVYQVVTVRGGQAARIEHFMERAEALEAAGLESQAR
jgi:ketosteroid isomerase-like protein